MTSIPVIPQVSLPKFGASQVIEGCLCSMSMEVWDIDVCFNLSRGILFEVHDGLETVSE